MFACWVLNCFNFKVYTALFIFINEVDNINDKYEPTYVKHTLIPLRWLSRRFNETLNIMSKKYLETISIAFKYYLVNKKTNSKAYLPFIMQNNWHETLNDLSLKN